MSQLRYRPDIDGLRALAVLPVIFFHMGLAWMPGGFVGVDVFFVISGYLIASIIARELIAGNFSILNFYVRRIRRIFPALFFVMAAVLVGGVVLFTPSDLNDVGKSAFAATFFASNILFWWETGYFAASAYSTPLLHTWSLAIEEQFYILLPMVLMVAAINSAKAWRRMGLWVLLLTLLSFLCSAFLTSRWPEAAYYLLPFRAWELGIGAMLALDVVPRFKTTLQRNAAGVTGILLLLGAALFLDKSRPFPGVLALLPVIGSALIIQAGRDGEHVIGRLLSLPPVVGIGKMSYSLYLWHWPIIVFFIYYAFDFPNLFQELMLLIVIFAVSWLTLRYVERPFRHARPEQPQWPTFAGAGVSMAAIAGVGALISLMDGLPERLSPEATAITELNTDRYNGFRECFVDKMENETWLEPCIYGATEDTGPVKIALWSDSHGPSILPGLERAAADYGERVALYGHDGCPGVSGLEVFWAGTDHSCASFIEDTFEAIKGDPDISLVIYAFRAPLYTQGWVRYGFAERDRSPLEIGTDNGPLPDAENRFSFFMERFEATIRELEENGKTVALIYPLPESGISVPAKMIRADIIGAAAEQVTVNRSYFDSRSGAIVEAFDDIAARTNIVPIRVDEKFCDEELCNLTLNGTPIFSDNNHLSRPAAEQLTGIFGPLLEQLQNGAAQGNTGGG